MGSDSAYSLVLVFSLYSKAVDYLIHLPREMNKSNRVRSSDIPEIWLMGIQVCLHRCMALELLWFGFILLCYKSTWLPYLADHLTLLLLYSRNITIIRPKIWLSFCLWYLENCLSLNICHRGKATPTFDLQSYNHTTGLVWYRQSIFLHKYSGTNMLPTS